MLKVVKPSEIDSVIGTEVGTSEWVTIDQERIKKVFGEALVSEINLSKEDALSMIKDCMGLISQTYTEREDILKEKYNMNELNSSEKRELQQIILKKDKMSQDEEALIKNLSSG